MDNSISAWETKEFLPFFKKEFLRKIINPSVCEWNINHYRHTEYVYWDRVIKKCFNKMQDAGTCDVENI